MVRVIFHLPLLVLALIVLTKAQNQQKPLGGGMKKALLKEHNKLRSQIAQGKFKDKSGSAIPRARDMLRLVWSKKLEKASLQAATKLECKMGASSNPNVGESQFAVSSNSTITDPEKLPIEAVRSWLNEFKESPWDTNLKTKPELIRAIQAVWGRTRRLGCGLVTCQGGKAAMVICQYKPKGNLDNKLAYKPANKPKDTCSFCKKKKHPCMKKTGLCK